MNVAALARFAFAAPVVMTLLAPAALQGQLPVARLTQLFPAGGQAGTQVEVTATGADLDEPLRLQFSHAGILATNANATNAGGRFIVVIASNVPPGTYEARFVGKFGMSNPRAFLVGTLPEILAEAGYTCGLCGKWHLGDNLKPQQGFTTWVTMPHGDTRTFYNADVIEDGAIRKEPEYLTDFWTDHGVKFIKQNKDRPFFLYLAYNGPYGLGQSMLEPARNRHAAYYADKELKSFPREKMNPWLNSQKKLLNNVEAMRRYAAEISGIDDGVGRILAALKENKIDDDTLVIFTADQGLAAGQNGLWGMGDHTRPLTAFDGTMHVPLIYQYPGHIRGGQRSDILVSNYDFLPTVLDYLGLKDKTPTKPKLPGRSYSGALHGEHEAWENTMFFEFETTRAIRTGDWKYIQRFPDGPNELYDLKSDPEERRNLVDQPEHASQQKELRGRLEDFFATYADPQYDLTRGGKSKAARRVK